MSYISQQTLRGLANTLSALPTGRALTGQQMQDDRRAAMQGYRNVRGPGGNLQRMMSPTEVNINRARELAGSGASPLMLNQRDRALQNAGYTLQAMDSMINDQRARSAKLSDLSYRDTVDQYGMNKDTRARTRQNWGWEDEERSRTRDDWKFEDEKRNFQRGVWNQARNMMGSGNATVGSVGGNYGVSGLR